MITLCITISLALISISCTKPVCGVEYTVFQIAHKLWYEYQQLVTLTFVLFNDQYIASFGFHVISGKGIWLHCSLIQVSIGPIFVSRYCHKVKNSKQLMVILCEEQCSIPTTYFNKLLLVIYLFYLDIFITYVLNVNFYYNLLVTRRILAWSL